MHIVDGVNSEMKRIFVMKTVETDLVENNRAEIISHGKKSSKERLVRKQKAKENKHLCEVCCKKFNNSRTLQTHKRKFCHNLKQINVEYINLQQQQSVTISKTLHMQPQLSKDKLPVLQQKEKKIALNPQICNRKTCA